MRFVLDFAKRAGFVVVVTAAVLGLSGCSGLLSSDESTPTPAQTTTPPPSTSEPPETSMNWEELAATTRSGVAHIGSAYCEEGTGSGTGFLVSDDLVVTAAHVVAGASSVQVRVGDALFGAMPLGIDEVIDIALLKIANSSDGYVFDLSEEEPAIGTSVGALGFPLNGEVEDAEESDSGLSLTQGLISSVNQGADWAASERESILKTNATLNAGNSGGPVVDVDGDVVAMAIAVQRSDGEFAPSVEGTGFAVTAQRIQQAIDEWDNATSFLQLQTCAEADAPEGFVFSPEVTAKHPLALDVAELFGLFAQGINSSNYDASYDLFSAKMKSNMVSAEEWSEGLASSYWAYADVYQVQDDDDALLANVEFWTKQDAEFAPEGTTQTCSIWDMQYGLVLEDEGWKIDSADLLTEQPLECDSDVVDENLGEQFPNEFG
ncbi:trypsin-like peptidase domain-containing protein [Glutamicibacter sp. NPDC087344]|uniref:trypsin-like peptidase domain-containing protein n=1 Tax=Glutamicibacter sp. NPDC087344 TaxID=3363994 RepID=UPI0037F2AA65